MLKSRAAAAGAALAAGTALRPAADVRCQRFSHMSTTLWSAELASKNARLQLLVLSSEGTGSWAGRGEPMPVPCPTTVCDHRRHRPRQPEVREDRKNKACRTLLRRAAQTRSFVQFRAPEAPQEQNGRAHKPL